MKVALISDTHVPAIYPTLPPELVDRLRGVDLILHAGDLTCLAVLESLQAIAPTVAVYGNMDEPQVRRQLPRKQLLSLEGRQIGLIHGHRTPRVERAYLRPDLGYDSPGMEKLYQYLANEFPEASLIVFGHTHLAIAKQWEGRLLVNPGSIAPHRGYRGFAMMDLGPTTADIEFIAL
ncbi:MAG: metallophosphoesterase family protein [Chloroflexi bacterium]|nr:metallophosphoesterase family protein [Chloroflexota bacterium]